MHYRKGLAYYLLLFLWWSSLVYGMTPIEPENVLSSEQIRDIISSRNYFYYRTLDESSPIWTSTNRQYSSHFLGNRKYFFSLNKVVHHVLTDGFPIQYKLQELYRAKLGIHSSIGNILPKINVTFGEGALITEVGQIFSGMFGFLLPANWMKLVNQGRAYKASKYILLRTVLDEMLAAKLLYLDQHQLIQELEILNYYFIHLQILARQYSGFDRVIETLRGQFAVEGTEMATQRGKTRLGFDDLANYMALEKLGGDYGAGTLNIEDIQDFPTKVKDLEELEGEYRDKETFLAKVVQRSIELRAILQFNKISKLNIGIAATGNLFTYVDWPPNPNQEARFAFRVGYDTLPNILIAKSFATTTKIDVRKEYLNMLNIARRSFDFYTNALGGYTEAKRSLKINREALRKNLNYLIESGATPDALFILALNQLINSELKLNNALHGSLRARAYMDRFLVAKDINYLQYLPAKGEIVGLYEKYRSEITNEIKKEDDISFAMRRVRRPGQLRHILYERLSQLDFEGYSSEAIKKGVEDNIGSLLYSSLTFHKSSQFFRILRDYIRENDVALTQQETYILNKKAVPLSKKILGKGYKDKSSYLHNFDFEQFKLDPKI